MHTISALARNASLPRRTVQYWHDQKIIHPLSRDPVVYSEDELILTRMLAPFGRIPATIATIRWLAVAFRLILQKDKSVPPRVANAAELARKGKGGFLIASPELMSDGETPWVWTYGVQGAHQIGDQVGRILDQCPGAAVIVVDLGYAFNTAISVGVAYDC